MNKNGKAEIVVIIPAFNEEKSIAKVIGDIPKELVSEAIVVNNNSQDNTSEVAEQAGATVLMEMQQGYGNACLKGIAYLEDREPSPHIVVFLDGDYSDYPEEMTHLVQPIWEEGVDMVIGSRALGNRARGSMTFPQIFGNWLATRMIRLFFGVKYTDLGPFR
ncbi:MAG: glycosyltransferase family 2 protein, partial [Bacteroidota bacterium]